MKALIYAHRQPTNIRNLSATTATVHNLTMTMTIMDTNISNYQSENEKSRKEGEQEQ